jgi:hypothetical protein
MRPDKPKPQAPSKPGTKDPQDDLAQKQAPTSAVKPERDAGQDTLAQLSHRERKGPTLH